MADPGFPVGGRQAIGGHQPLTWVFFGENICKNERIGSCWGRPLVAPPGSANADTQHKFVIFFYLMLLHHINQYCSALRNFH